MISVRGVAIEVLIQILNHYKRPKQAVESRTSSLDRRDRAFLMEIVYGVLRYRDTLDWILSHFLKNQTGLNTGTLNNLRIALYQLLFMRVPDWAAVHEAVELEKNLSLREAATSDRSSLVNAVLRNFLRRQDHFTLPIQINDKTSFIAINTSHPVWIIKRWIKRFGPSETSRLAQSNNQIPPLSVRSCSLRISRDELLQKFIAHGISAEISRYAPSGILLNDVHSYSDLSFAAGLFSVQDESSQLISFILDPQPGERVLDACAAPGGKTTHIAELMDDRGEIVAVEKDPLRIVRLKSNISALGIRSIRVINGDITSLTNMGTFDRILVDAPCSSLGVIRRNPDVKYRHREKALLQFKRRQLELLHSVSLLLSEKGRIAYSVCSTEPEEGEDVINDFLKTEQDFRIINTQSNILNQFIDNGFFRTYPHRHSMDGFFGVALCRKK